MQFFLLLFTLIPVLAGISENLNSSSVLPRKDGTSIHYYLEFASDELASDTLMVSFQGSDCNSVKYAESLRVLSTAIWPSADLLLIEKLGITSNLHHDTSSERPDCPDYYIEHDAPTQRIEDARNVVNHVLSSRKYKNVLAVGASEGATIAAMFAAEIGAPKAVIFINGGGRFFQDDVLHNIGATVPATAVQTELDGFRDFVKRILDGEPFHFEMSDHGYNWWREMLAIDQKTILHRIDVPVLAVQGGRDESVSAEAVVEMIKTLREEDKVNVELALYPDLDHGLYDLTGERMIKEVAEEIKEWLRSKM